jgi:hypothetical protein
MALFFQNAAGDGRLLVCEDRGRCAHEIAFAQFLAKDGFVKRDGAVEVAGRNFKPGNGILNSGSGGQCALLKCDEFATRTMVGESS